MKGKHFAERRNNPGRLPSEGDRIVSCKAMQPSVYKIRKKGNSDKKKKNAGRNPHSELKHNVLT